MHDHKSPTTCIFCSVKHLGAAKVKLGEALASTDEERRRARILDATFELNEAETTHLGSEYPDFAQRVRKLRKGWEEVAFGEKTETKDLQEQLAGLIEDLTKEQIRQARESVPRGTAVTKEGVLGAIQHYEREYQAPASVSDIQFVLAIPQGSELDKEIDRSLERAPAAQVRQAAEELLAEGKVKTTEFGGYVNPDKAIQRFNIPEPQRRVKMTLNGTRDVLNVVGSSFAGKIIGQGLDAADEFVTPKQPPHGRLSTYAKPLLGAAAVLYAWHKTRRGGGDGMDLSLAITGASLLSEGVVTSAEQFYNLGPSGFVVRSYAPVAGAPARRTSNNPLF